MSARAISFVEEWLAERIQPSIYHDEESPEERNSNLAEQLLLDASSAGIPEEEIAEDFPDLAGQIATAMKSALNDDETRRDRKD
jgi:hypothetical protein